MEKTSRRKFSKQITGALAALPVAALANESVSAQEQQKRQSQPTVPRSQRKLTSHNTPPDVVISEGSLNIESSIELTGPPSPPFIYVGRDAAEIGHIRVLLDTGQIIYEDLESHGSEVAITWEDDNPPPGTHATGDLKFQASDERTLRPLTITTDKRFNTPANNPPAHRRFKFSHPGSNSSARRMRIKSLTVTTPDGMTTSFAAPPPPPPGGPMAGEFFPHEFRVLIWLH